jgi:hypothetical protein
VISQINAVTAPFITASIDSQNQLVLTGTGLGAGHNIHIVGDVATLVALGLTAGITTGAVNILEPPQLILPFSSQPNRPVVLSGTAPSAVSLATSLEIQLPMQVNNIQVQNTGGANLYVAFEPTGPEFVVYPLASAFTNLYETYPAASQIFVRGSGGTTTFNMISALRNNPIS